MQWRDEGRAVLSEYLGVELVKYRHMKYGTGVVVGKVEGPLCKASMVFATEPKDDKGHTHCLEHLCFMETKTYPRGFLDLLATRCGSQGTNAFTEFDHTQYEFEVTGEPGLVRVLPVFMNHVLCPLLSESGFTTEIFHINGKGEQQGVVYSEMAGRENSEMDLMWNSLLKRMFGSTAPYSYETGGLSSEIAKLTRQEIVDYHREVYTTDNLNIIVTGQFDTQVILNTIDQALVKAVEAGARVECLNRAFSKKLPANDYPTTRAVVPFPSEDTSIGSIAYGFKLHKGLTNIEEQTALEVMWRYLTGLSSSPLNQAFVELEFPIASSVFGDLHLACEPFGYLEFSGVPYNGIELLNGSSNDGEIIENSEEEEEDEEDEEDMEPEPPASPSTKMSPLDWFRGDGMISKLIDELESVLHKLESQGPEWDHLKKALLKERLSNKEDFEDSPHEIISSGIAPELIFEGYPTGKKIPFGAMVDKHAAFEFLEQQNVGWWISFLRNTMISELKDAKEKGFGAVEIKMVPSMQLVKKNEMKTTRVTRANAKRYGPAGLARLQKIVEDAKEANQINLSIEEKATFPTEVHISDVKDIPRKITHTMQPIETIEVDMNCSFLDLRLYFDYSRTPPALLRYLYLFHELLLETDMDGVDYRRVVQKMDEDLVSSSCGIGKYGKFMMTGTQPTCFSVLLCAEVEKAGKLVHWLDNIINKVTFNEEKVRTTCKTLVADITEHMRDGQTVLDHCVTFAAYQPDSINVLVTPFSQRSFLRRALKDIPATIEKLEQLRKVLASPDTRMSLFVGGGTHEIRKSVITGLSQALPSPATRPPLYSDYKWGLGCRDKFAKRDKSRGFAVGVGGVDTAYIHLSTQVDVAPKDKKEYWALYLLCECISIGEGELQLEIRGRGLAYGAGVYFHTFEGTVSLDIWECTNIKGCIQGALEILRQIPNEDCDTLSEFNVKNAIGSVVCGLKSKRSTPSDIMGSTSTAAAKGFFNVEDEEEFEALLHTITHEDLLDVYEKHVQRLLQKEELVAGVVCDPKSVESAAKAMSQALQNMPFTVHKNLKTVYPQADELISITVA